MADQHSLPGASAGETTSWKIRFMGKLPSDFSHSNYFGSNDPSCRVVKGFRPHAKVLTMLIEKQPMAADVQAQQNL